MNTPIGIDFSEARETLEKLTVYIKQKIQKKTAAAQPTADMNLAFQPEIKSDHLGEEVPLSPVSGIQQVESANNGTPEVLTSNDTLIESTPVNSNEGTLGQANSLMQDFQPGMGTVVGTNQQVSQMGTEQVQAAPLMQNFQPGMGTVVGTNQQVSQMGTEQVQAEPLMQNFQPGMGTVVDTGQQVSQMGTEQVQAEPLIQNFQPGMGTVVDTGQQVGPVTEEKPKDISQTTTLEDKMESSMTPGLENIPSIDISGVLNSQEQNNGLTENLENNQILESTSAPADTGYKAMTNNATVGYPTTPAPSTTPVVMPNGMPQGISSSDSLVVGPEAFNITR